MQAQAVLDARGMMPCCRVCVQAAHSGNVSASVCLAQVDDARGDIRSALKYWAKAAKLGHPEAQFRLGRVRFCAILGSCCCASICLHKDFLANVLTWEHLHTGEVHNRGSDISKARIDSSLYATCNA